MADRPVWAEDGRDWPNRAASRFVSAGGVRWHVQVAGAGPVALLVHGTGAATHSWRGVLPVLARDFTVVAPDLPGHGFTGPAGDQGAGDAGASLPGMAGGLAALLGALGLGAPALAAGHSAGAAILARMCLDGAIDPAALVSLNGALLPLRGMPFQAFAPLARALFANALVPRLFAWRAADPRVVDRLLAGTGSRLDAQGAALYGRLARRPGHAAGALAMMANWDLRPLERDLPRLRPRLVLVVGDQDRTIAPAEQERVRALVRGASLVRLAGLGHLAHEEQPERVAAIIAHAGPLQAGPLLAGPLLAGEAA